jgi:hypothetical protein
VSNNLSPRPEVYLKTEGKHTGKLFKQFVYFKKCKSVFIIHGTVTATLTLPSWQMTVKVLANRPTGSCTIWPFETLNNMALKFKNKCRYGSAYHGDMKTIYCNRFDQCAARQQLCKHSPTRNNR